MSASGAQIVLQRKAWARDVVILAWGRVEHLASISAVVPKEVCDLAAAALRDAVAIAEEWGLDPQEICDEVSAAAEKDRRAARRVR
jgi:hypothetical protein